MCLQRAEEPAGEKPQVPVGKCLAGSPGCGHAACHHSWLLVQAPVSWAGLEGLLYLFFEIYFTVASQQALSDVDVLE